MLSRPLLARLSGDDDLGIPDVASALDLRLLERISASVPWLGARDGWHVRFRRELNATDDRHRFVPASGDAGARPVLEGKHVAPFRVAMDRCTMALAPGAGGARIPLRPRLAYRDVASATNRLTLIAAIVPARAVTTHTLFCLKTPLPLAAQRVLCALMNSFVANYVARMRVNTHVTAALVARLPVPRVVRTDPAFDRLSALAGELAAGRGPADSMPQYQEVQALAAQLYGLSRDEFAHVLSTFPLVPDAVRTGALERFSEAIAGARLRPPGE